MWRKIVFFELVALTVSFVLLLVSYSLMRYHHFNNLLALEITGAVGVWASFLAIGITGISHLTTFSLESFLDFGKKEPIRSAMLIVGTPSLIFVLGCVLASGLTYRNISPVVMTGGIIALVAFIILAFSYKARAKRQKS